MICFLDYYHPFAGLCNQLYLITNHLTDAYLQGNELYIHKVNIDIFKKKRIPVSEFFDIPKTCENLKKLVGRPIIVTEKPEIVNSIPKLCIYPVRSIEILNCLEFHDSILKHVNVLKSKFCNEYNGIHFRLETDVLIHYVFGKNDYTVFMELCNESEELALAFFESLDQSLIDKYCNFLLNQYFECMVTFGFEKPWYICSSINKYPIHKGLTGYLNKLINFITSHKGIYGISEKCSEFREINALVDLLVLRDSCKTIGFEGSSFSEGYCYKVNSIRNPGKSYLFIKENEV